MQSTTRPALALFFACLLFHLAGTWIVPLIDRDEPRFAEASREMIERHDFIVPFFNGEYRFDKPPLTYWAQVASYEIFGENDFAARFPSAVAAAAVAVILFFWGRRLTGSDRGGWNAALIFSLSFQVVEHAKAAVADMWLVLFVTLAHWAAWEMIENRKSKIENPRRWWWLFYVSLALAFLAKGPIGWTPLLTVAAMRFITGLPSRRFLFVRGIALTLALVALWGVPALIQTHGEFFRIGIGRHVVGRSIGVIGGHGARSPGFYLLLLPFYFVTIFLTFFPWSLKLPWLAKKLWRERDAADSYLIAGTLVIFGIFTLVTTRLLHYTLPAFPLLALLLGRALARQETSRFVQRCAWVMAPICLVCALTILPLLKVISPARELIAQAHKDLRPETAFAVADYREPSIVWYSRAYVRPFMIAVTPPEAASFMNKPGPRFVILPSASAAETFPAIPPDWKTFSTSGYNAVKGRRTDLKLILKP